MVLYDKTMRHIEMHVISNTSDERLANLAGLDTYDDESCAQCREPLGTASSDTSFKAYVIVLDDDSEWVVCVSCASPVLNPDS
jgi:hypothetical protein